MAISIFDLFPIGVGPSSSHTVGPMRAAREFVVNLQRAKPLSEITSVIVDLYGSLALTGKGHATDMAILLGLEGETPEGVDPETIALRLESIRQKKTLSLLGLHPIPFEEETHLLFHGDKQLPFHPNGMRFRAFNQLGQGFYYEVFYSVGGGFIINHEAVNQPKQEKGEETRSLPYPFQTADELLSLCRQHELTIDALVLENERTWRSDEEIRTGLLKIWEAMKSSVKRGCQQEGILPGGLNVKRRAASMYRSLTSRESLPLEERDSAEVLDWVSLWALAVNEENAAGSRVVTAPTNGSAGVIPAVMHYYERFTKNPTEKGILSFLLTAGAIGILYKKGASISAAEMGCMGEVGVACSMAAAGLASALGASNEQIENAAEIGMEHHLGLTCDPIKGLVQIPCIERNAMGAAKAINAERLARLYGNGEHRVSLDQVIATMRQTGLDMNAIYKETSQGGLAVNVPEC